MNLGLLTVKGYMKFVLINLFKAQKFLGVVQYSHPQTQMHVRLFTLYFTIYYHYFIHSNLIQ